MSTYARHNPEAPEYEIADYDELPEWEASGR